ncbi:MAG: MoxR family ATPase [Pseudomonadota bacterium]
MTDPSAARQDSGLDPVTEARRAADLLGRVRTEIAKRVIGQGQVVDLSLISILCGGHGLLVGAPGLAKTRLVETMGTVLGLNAKRVQFTPDLMPADILGAEVLEETSGGGRAFRFIEGPIFCQLLMADEINRASPRTQSALLQAMQEHHVTVAGQRRDLPEPFHVLATQNPIEQEGTYPLPEAQLDRFLVQIDVDYPDRDAERDILLSTTGVDDAATAQMLDAAELMRLQRLVREIPVGDSVVETILTLVRSGRPDEPEAHPMARETLSWGPGPRAAQALMLAVRARALIEGRFAPGVEDVKALAPAALKHRMALTFAARAEGKRLDQVIAALIEDACG